MNLHRVGLNQHLTSLDREMRCRIWHQLRVLEFRAALDRGDKSDIDEDSYTTPPLSNVHDEDIAADDFDIPHERQEITSSTFSVLSQQCVTLCKRLNQLPIGDSSHQQLEEEWNQKQRLIIEFEQKLDTVFRLCDDQIPSQWYIKTVFGGLMPTFRIMFYRPLWQRSRLRPQPAGPNQLLDLALESLQKEIISVSAPNAQPYAWHIWVQWYTLAVALAELCVHSGSDRSDLAWEVVELSYAHQSQHIADSVNGKLWKPIRELMKRARSLRKTKAYTEVVDAQRSSCSETVHAAQPTDPAQVLSGKQSAMSSPIVGIRDSSDIPTFSDDTWVLQQSIMDSGARDEAWAFWEDFVEELSAF